MDSKTLMIAVGIVAAIAVIGVAAVGLGGGNGGDDNEYVVYHGNGGSYDGKDVIMATTETVMINVFSYDGHTFVKWNTKADGTGTDYAKGDTVSKGTHLYAIWKDTKPLTIVSSIKDVDGFFKAYLGDTSSGEVHSLDEGYLGDLPDNAAILFLIDDATGLVTTINDDTVYITHEGDKGFRMKFTFTGATAQFIKMDSGNIGIKLKATSNTVNVSVSTVPGFFASYYANNGTEDYKSDSTCNVMSASDLKITYDGHTFVKWNTKSDGTGTDYNVGDRVPYCMRLYAIWS